MIADLSDAQFNTLVTAVGGLLLAVLQWIMSQRNKAGIDECKAHVETVKLKVDDAEVKRTETSLVVNRIEKDVNKNTTVSEGTIREQAGRMVQMSEKIASLEGRLTPIIPAAPVIAPVAPLLTDAHIEQIARRVNELSKQNSGRVETVLAVPSTFDGPGGAAVPIAPEQLKQMVGNQK